MRNRRPGPKMAGGGFDAQRYLRLLAIPIIVVILILVIVIVDRSPKSKETHADGTSAETMSAPGAAGTEAAPTDGSQEQGETKPDDPFALNRNEIPEINALMEAYCQAKANCDAETMYALYGKADTSDIEELRTRMQWRAKYIESFENIVCYTIPGLEDDSYLVYVSSDIKFRVTDTLAPNLMWCYVTKNQDGEFIIQENVSKDALAFVAKAEQSEGVRLLASQINARLEEAVESDTKLASAYGMLREDAAAPGEETTAAMSLETTAPESGESSEGGTDSAASEGDASLEGQVASEEETAQDASSAEESAASPEAESQQ